MIIKKIFRSVNVRTHTESGKIITGHIREYTDILRLENLQSSHQVGIMRRWVLWAQQLNLAAQQFY